MLICRKDDIKLSKTTKNIEAMNFAKSKTSNNIEAMNFVKENAKQYRRNLFIKSKTTKKI